MKNFKQNEQDLYDFNIWLLTNGDGCVQWMAEIATEYLCMIQSLKEMNE